MNTEQIDIGGIPVEVVLKDIKNIHLSVHPPTGRVRISAPAWVKLETIRVYAISKLDWIKKQQGKLQSQERETRREYIDRESHFLWGRRYLLKVNEAAQVPVVELKHNQMVLTVRPGSEMDKREEIVYAWYRDELRNALTPLIDKWGTLLGVHANRIIIRRMKTKWGSCNPRSRNIHLNTELAKKPRECLEYIIVHELVHLLESTHNAGFVSLMDKSLPQWRQIRDELNQEPLAHEEWKY
jgi:predicted metal-dependent hydrolase